MTDQTAFTAPRTVIDAPRQTLRHRVPVLVIGGGAAGLTAALAAARRVDVLLLTRTALPESNSAWAQGGIAAALDDDDSPQMHVDDTLIAGAGLCDLPAVEVLTAEAPELMRELNRIGVPFDRAGAALSLGLEGGHSRRRIVHVGDATGWAVTRTLIERVRSHPRIRIVEGMQAVDLLGNERCTGVLALDPEGRWHRFEASATILATGGAGALYGLTSNQPVALGEGIALAFRAGAEIADMEFVQFHPTVMRTASGRGFLISEAARGEGGILRSVTGERFMPAYDPRGELAPRDVVTRGIYAAMRRSHSDHVLLDLSHLEREELERHFPTITARCREEGIDISTTPIPVAPASHYLMGGIRTDLNGATSLPGLYAAGECACTGVHGANRLASNSLLECLVFGRRAGALAAAQSVERHAHLADLPETAPPSAEQIDPFSGWRGALADLMRAAAGPLRNADDLAHGSTQIAAWSLRAASADGEAIAAANAALVARLIIESARFRTESRGGHFRSDCPQTSAEWQAHTIVQRDAAPRLESRIAPEQPAFAFAQAAD